MICILFCITLISFLVLLLTVFRGIIIDILAVKHHRTHRQLYIDWCKREYDSLYDRQEQEDWAEFEYNRMEDYLAG